MQLTFKGNSFLLITALFAVGFFLCPTQSFSQTNLNYTHICGSDVIRQKHLNNAPKGYINPEIKDNAEAEKYQVFSATPDTDVRIIPVVFHIIHTYGTENISKKIIQEQLATLNETFRKKNADTSKIYSAFKNLSVDCKIEFRLANIDPWGDCTDGIDRIYSSLTDNATDNVKGLVRAYWDNTKYLNIWVVRSISNLGTQGTVYGYTQYPWESVSAAKTDGIIIRADKVGRDYRILTHEVGHYFGLYHTFEGGCGSNCSKTGDHICDTPPADGPNYSCNTKANSCNNESPDMPDMVENFMDYSDCIKMFTAGQKNRMGYFMGKYRSNIISATNLRLTGITSSSGTCSPISDFYTLQSQICEGGMINYFDNSSNGKVESYRWLFPGGTPNSDTIPSPMIRYKNPGTYSVKLSVTNTNGSDSIIKIGFVKILPTKSSWKAPFNEDFESINLLKNGWHTNIDGNGIGWQITSNAGFSGYKSIYVDHNADLDYHYSFLLPPVSISSINSPNLKFKLAYRRFDASSTDELQVLASFDCGETFTKLYQKAGSDLATTSDGSRNFIPDNTDWKARTIDLSTLKNKDNIIFKFDFISHLGSDIYIDDLNLNSKFTGIEGTSTSKNSFNIYPNPSNNNFNLIFKNTDSRVATFEVSDITGKAIFVSPKIYLTEGEQSISFSTTETNITSAGVYYIKMQSGETTFVRKLVIVQ